MDDITAGTVDEVLARVGTDADLAAAVLEAEQEKPDDKRRSTLIEALERVIDAATNPSGDGGEQQGDVGPEVFTAPDAGDTSAVEQAQEKIGPKVYRIKR